ncbi:cell surface pattern recognition receptor signaling pathway, partial [Branchiostoma belcheri]
VFQKRQDGSEDFFRDWQAYKTGFGDLRGEFWLGDYELRVDLEDFEGNSASPNTATSEWRNEFNMYRLTAVGYSGTAGDALAVHDSMFFSTKDRDNDNPHDTHCAQTYKGGWWYNRCQDANLNGLYHAGPHQSVTDGVSWKQWKGQFYSLKLTEMKLRPI